MSTSQFPAAGTTVSPSKLVAKSNTAGEALVGVASVTGANGTSAWGQVSSSLPADTLITKVHVSLSTGGFTPASISTISIGIGAVGSETSIATVPVVPSYTGSSALRGMATFSIPLRVASGQNLSARITDPGLSGVSVNMSVYGAAYTNVEGN